MRARYIAVCLLLATTVVGEPLSVELLDCFKIWDDAPHSAFTDLVWKGHFICAFRQGRGHVSTDGRIRVIYSPDGENWRDGAVVKLDGYDLRDAHLSIMPDGRFMLLGGAAPRKKDNERTPTGSFVSFSADGLDWSEPEIVVEPGRWLWQASWHEGRAYGVSYAAYEGTPMLELLTSRDGLRWESHVSQLFGQGRPTEVALRFAENGTCYALVRREGQTDESTAMLGDSRPPYAQWRWRDLGGPFKAFGGPNFIHIAGPHWVAAGRMHQDGAHTALTHLDVNKGVMTKLLKLPSGGDTSYPGLVYVNGLLYVSYYSSHEGRTSIYMAKVKVNMPPDPNEPETFGAEANPTGDPIGGGSGYSRIVAGGDFRVNDANGLAQALSKARSGQTVYVEDSAQIDLTGRKDLRIGEGVILASGRGRDGSEGGLLFATDLGASPVLLAGGQGVRVTGLRLRGPDDQRRTEQMAELHKQGKYYSIPNSDGIVCSHSGLEVDNCEIWAFSHAGVFLKEGATGAHIHHNSIHHCQRSGLGYGVCLDRGDAVIEANRFDWCRHHIAGTGRPRTNYEARYNVVGPNANGHSFDMHGGADRKDGTDIAGDRISIHHNTFKAGSVRAVLIRGKPRQICEIHHNRFAHADAAAAVGQTNARENLRVFSNVYATDGATR